MPNRTAKFASAILASVLANSPLVTGSGGAARAGNDCLSGPKDETPAGQHWYYRIEHPSNRHCWYLRDEREKPTQSAAQNLSPAAKPASPRPETPRPETMVQHSIADARAEWPAPSPVEQPNRLNLPGPALPANTPAMTENTKPQRSVIASRWPDSSDPDPVVNPAPAKIDPGTGLSANAQIQPASVVAAGKSAVADWSSPTSTNLVPMQLVALAGALALAGMLGRVIFKFGSPRRPRQNKVRVRRGPVWEATDDDRIALSAHPGADALSHQSSCTRGLDRAHDPDQRIAEFFAQISRRAPT